MDSEVFKLEILLSRAPIHDYIIVSFVWFWFPGFGRNREGRLAKSQSSLVCA